MLTVLLHNLLKLLHYRTALIYLLLVEGGSLLALLTVKYLWSQAILTSQLSSNFIIFFLQLCFFWLLGLPWLLFIFVQGCGLISRERKEGTLLLLVSKPIARYKIIVGKWLALVLAAFILGLCSLIITLGLIAFFVLPDYTIIYQLLRFVPFWGLYILYLTFCLAAVAISLSVFTCSSRMINLLFLGLGLFFYVLIPIGKAYAQLQVKMEYLNWLDLAAYVQNFYYFLISIPQVIYGPNFSGYCNAVFPLGLLLPGVISIIFMVAAIRRFESLDIC
ncbi:MAG: ABC transporter permease subunit [Peptococcaceae bacterium]|nr:ABC transporter permease subunit [Peptococcaceae bacterium]